MSTFINIKSEIIEVINELNDDDIYQIQNYLQPLISYKKIGLKKNYIFDEDKFDNVKNILDSQKKNAEFLDNPKYDLKYRSRYFNRNIFNSNYFNIYGKYCQSIYMSDYIMFNKFNVPFYKLEKYLSFCKIKYHDNNTIQIDGWIIKKNNYDYKNTEILYDDSNLEELKLCNNEYEYCDVIRNLKIIMDFTPTEYINSKNYYVLDEWYYQNQLLIGKAKCEITNSIFDIKNKLSENQLNIRIEKKISLDDIFKILYNHSINGLHDKFEMFGLNEKESKLLNSIKNNTLIQEYEKSPIYVVINNESINLENYLKYNGLKRTYNCINSINYTIKNKYYCENITKEELLCELYNSQSPFGMGIFQSSDKILTIDNSKKLFIKNDYFDYLYGVAIKINFSDFPIINYERFDSRNGEGSFIKCIENILSNKKK